MMKKLLLIFLSITAQCVFGQTVPDTSGIQRYFYPNGKLSSEGPLREGKPDGYWKTYDEEGMIKSEGNRKNFELDSTWKFYGEEGKLALEITYKNGKKNGIRKTYREGEYYTENFVNDVKQGMSMYYYPDGKLHKSIPFVNGLEQGIAREFDTNGRIIQIQEYRKGFIVSRENINRTDKDGRKQGTWKDFWENGNIRSEGNYRNDKRNGIFKEYMTDGKLFKVFKYENDSLIPDAEEVAKIDVRADYYPNGQVKIMAQYKNNQPDGIRREFSADGKLERGSVYFRGIRVGEGITDMAGFRQGPWKEFYESGQLKAEGKYKDGKRIGEWKFYHPNAKIEETGYYDNKGRLDGDWKWYYEDGELRKEMSFSEGLEDGPMAEYSEDGKVIVKGTYVEGQEQDKWIFEYGDHKEEGNYVNGMLDGEWKYYYDNGKLQFSGRFVEDQPDGRHIYYWYNGNKKDEGLYVMGKKQGDWIKYNEDGSIFLVVTYKNGLEIRYDGVKIVPEIQEEE
jgi:antitoxin component YwqK of YwqJK toxin-antitoxin module